MRSSKDLSPSDEPDDFALIGNWIFTDLTDLTGDLDALDGQGLWTVLVPFEGGPVCARFASVQPAPRRWSRPWTGLADTGGSAEEAWDFSLDEDAFRAGVATIRDRIAAGSVYQVNLTRRCRAPLPPGADIAALATTLAEGNPAPFSAVLRLARAGIHIASASPEQFLGRDGSRLWSAPIKGTAATRAELRDKDTAENVMIVDLVRNDLGRICEFGSIRVRSLCEVESHPGLVHLVSTVEGNVRSGVRWADILDATFPPGSVTGAPKVAALEMIRELEPVPRGPYCGAIGWVDADRNQASLNVAIRTFWFADGFLNFGTGGGITWGSDPAGEWDETVLKARRLVELATHGEGEVPR